MNDRRNENNEDTHMRHANAKLDQAQNNICMQFELSTVLHNRRYGIERAHTATRIMAMTNSIVAI